MNPILQAIEEGYPEDEILKYISKAIPKLVPKINKALSNGYGIKEVLGFLGKSSPQDTRGMSESQIHRRNRDLDSDLTKKGLISVGTLAVTPVASKALNSALSRSLPQSLKGLAPSLASQSALPEGGNVQLPANANPLSGIQQTSTSMQPQMQSSSQAAQSVLPSVSQQPPVNQVAPNIAQGAEAMQPEVISNPREYLEKLGIRESVDDLLKRGNSPDATMAAIQLQGGKGRAKENPELLKNIEEYAKQKPETLQKNPSLEQKKKEVGGSNEAFKIEKGSVVDTPNGPGKIIETRNGKSIVEINGKKIQLDDSSLEKEPQDIADLYDNLFNAIPDEYKSRMMNYAGYDEDANELIFRPHGGAAYVYKDIPPEFANDLKNRLHRAKTTGKNMYGMWHEGDQSFGAGMSKLIKELQVQYGGKGKEYVRKYNTLFDILGIPHEEKKRKEQEERRKRKANG